MTSSEIAHQYALDVQSGKVVACKWVKLATKRYLNDLKKQTKKAFPYRYDEAKANRVCFFIQLFKHVKGEKARGNLQLEPWQRFINCQLFGWVEKATGFRRFRIAYIEVARKNGKSTMSAPLALYMLAADGEDGAEVYSAATTRDQARIVFDAAKSMAQNDKDFCKKFGIKTPRNAVSMERTASSFKALSSEAGTLDGLNIHLAVIDELHAHPSPDVYEVLETAIGARRQPLLYAITTAGSDQTGICYEKHLYCKKVLEGKVKSDQFFGIIFTIDDGDDWTDPKVWAKANPNLGVSIKPDILKMLCDAAKDVPRQQNNFKTKHLNVWVNAAVSWMNMHRWDQAQADVKLEDFAGCQAWIGIDLASKIDIAALGIIVLKDDKYYQFCKFYLPEEAILESRNGSNYAAWVQQGLITVTQGSVIDFEYIEEDLQQLCRTFEVQEIGFDPWSATQFSTRMLNIGLPMVEVGMNVKSLSEPMKQLEAQIYDKKLLHDGNPVLRWMAGNVTCRMDHNGNIYPRKEKENDDSKIDGMLALIIAMSRVLFGKPPAFNIYDDPSQELILF